MSITFDVSIFPNSIDFNFISFSKKLVIYTVFEVLSPVKSIEVIE